MKNWATWAAIATLIASVLTAVYMSVQLWDRYKSRKS